jgi:CheY-like chemotaxis protein
VLVVDNDAAVVAAMRALLEGWDCEVLVAHDAASARDACARDRPDLLVLDYHLDDGATGLELRARLDASLANVPCIVVSADHGDDVRRAVAQAGVHLLHKPLKPLALKSLMARLLAAA